MKAIFFNKFGGPEVLEEGQVPIPDVQEGFVRVKISAISFNPVDYKIRKGFFGGNFPNITGADFSGVVDEIGSGVSTFKKGDEVYGMSIGIPMSNGSYAEYISISQELISPKPKNISHEEAASSVVAGLTAVHAADRVKLGQGKSVLIVGASGGVGQYLVQIVKNSGATVIATAGSDESVALLNKSFGVPLEQIVNYKGLNNQQIQEKVIAANNGKPVDIAFDLFGGPIKQVCVESLAFSGEFVTIVDEAADGNYAPLYPCQSPKSLFINNCTYHFVFIASATFKDSSYWSFVRKTLEKLTLLFESGKLKASAIKNLGKLSLDTVKSAHQQLENHSTHAKIVVSLY